MEGSYKLNRFAQTAEEAEARVITNPQSLEKDKKSEKNESGHPEMLEGRFPGFSKNLYEYFVEYSNNTTIQGIRYMGEQSRPVLERLAWLICFSISLYFCIDLIIASYTKWKTTPVIVNLATRPTPIWNIPFPAVTFCPETKTRKKVFDFTDIKNKVFPPDKNLTREQKKHFAELSIICNFYDFKLGNKTMDYDAIEFFMKTAPMFEVVDHCNYPLPEESCKSSLTPIITEAGICLTFNMLDRREFFRDNIFQFNHSYDLMSHETHSGEWTLEGGYKENTSIHTYPRRMVSAGMNFNLKLRTELQDMDYVCNGGVQGYKIILHHPAEAPRMLNHFVVPNDKEITIAVKPDMMKTSEGLRNNYDPHERQCYFSEERYLAFYRTYTQQNCETECLTNFTRTKCGCVAFHMPHKNETPICGSRSQGCIKKAKYEILSKDFQSSMRPREEADPNGPPNCGCLPGCVSLTYNAEVSQADANTEKAREGFLGFKIRDIPIAYTNLHIFFKEQQFIMLERNELYGKTDFLSSCGGILGLFTGFSFLSLVEIFYFLSLRLFCNVKRYGRHYWSGSQELVNNDKYDHKK